MLLSRAVAVLAVLVLAGCPGPNEGDNDASVTDAEVEPCPIGDRSLPLEVAPVTARATAEVVALADGDVVELVRPIQGGKVIYVGFKARNVDGCNLHLTAALRDPATNLIIALEQRPVRMEPGSDGWGEPLSPFYSLANVAACPSATPSVDVDQGTWRLEMRLEETIEGGRTAEAALDVLPRCREPGAITECECECDVDYALGMGCTPDPVDAGVD